MLHDGAILHNQFQIASDHLIYEKLHKIHEKSNKKTR